MAGINPTCGMKHNCALYCSSQAISNTYCQKKKVRTLRDYPERIKDLREGRGLSVAEVAAGAGVREATIDAVEAGSYRPSLDLAIRIARALGTTLDDLVGME